MPRVDGLIVAQIVEQRNEGPRLVAAKEQPRTVELASNMQSWALVVLAALAVVACIRAAADLLIPLVIALLVAYSLAPIVTVVERLGLRRWVAAAVVVTSVVGGSVVGVYVLREDIAAAVNRLPDATAKLRREMRAFRNGPQGPMDALGKAAENLDAAAAETAARATGANRPYTDVTTPALRLREALVVGSMSLLGLAGQLVLLTLLVYFVLASGDLFKRKLVRIAGPRLSRRRAAVHVVDDINKVITRFLVVLLITSGMVTLGTWIAFRAIGLSNALVWSIVGGVLNIVPYFGPLIAVGIYVLVAFLQFGSLKMALLTAGVFVFVTSIEGNWVKPQLMSRAANLNSVAVFVNLLLWSWLWGAWGLLLAFPILMVVKVVADRVDALRAVGELLGE